MHTFRSLWLFAAALVFLMGCNDKDGSTTETPMDGPMPKFEWVGEKGTFHDFGKIAEGDIVKHVYKFKNMGDADLIIEKVKPSCGCTAPNWTQNPIPPGESGEIEIEFNSTGKGPMVSKTVTVIANTDPEVTELSFRAEVAPTEGGKE